MRVYSWAETQWSHVDSNQSMDKYQGHAREGLSVLLFVRNKKETNQKMWCYSHIWTFSPSLFYVLFKNILWMSWSCPPLFIFILRTFHRFLFTLPFSCLLSIICSPIIKTFIYFFTFSRHAHQIFYFSSLFSAFLLYFESFNYIFQHFDFIVRSSFSLDILTYTSLCLRCWFYPLLNFLTLFSNLF